MDNTYRIYLGPAGQTNWTSSETFRKTFTKGEVRAARRAGAERAEIYSIDRKLLHAVDLK